ncbi:9050_t:CDS:2, partial [Paraglomus brasilianum]
MDLNVKFRGWEVALDSDDFTLPSILKFRRTKKDFSSNKQVEHTAIAKFVSYVEETAVDEKWRKAASVFNKSGELKRQAQWEAVETFWREVELEEIEKDNQLLSKKMDQVDMRFCLDQSLAGNEAHVILNRTKLDCLSKRENLKRKAVPNVDTGKSDTNTVSGTITGGMFIDRSSESKTDREKDEIDDFFLSTSEQQSSNPFEQDTVNKTDNERDKKNINEMSLLIALIVMQREINISVFEFCPFCGTNIDADTSKLQLSTGKIVEDVLFEFVKDIDYE